MEDNQNIQYGIKYRVIKLEEDKYILFPVSLEKGIETEDGFRTAKRIIPYAYDKENLDNNYVIDMVMGKEELQFVYDYNNEDEFLLDYFFEDFKNTLVYLETNPKDCYMTSYEINLDTLTNETKLTYIMENAIPSIVLNEKALNEILGSNNLEEAKLIITKYKKLLKKFSDYSKTKGITRINVANGQIESVEVNKGVSSPKDSKDEMDLSGIPIAAAKSISAATVSYQGLRRYIKERVLGHDEEIDTFAQKLYMNYTAEEGEAVESILLVGPTGTGKTETVKAACEYLDIPSFSVNASNIVPQGIKGMSIEDVIIGLFEKANYDEKKAQRGLVFLDEFDKLNDSDLDLKSDVKNILLTFTAGGTFPIDNDRYTFLFDSSMTNKVYAGVFDKIYRQKRNIGFGNDITLRRTLGTEEEIRNKIIRNGYFTLEELSRISTILGFEELDRDTKKRIILDSKLSEFAKKKRRYKRQFNIDLEADESYIEAILDSLSEDQNGMRSLNNYIKRTINKAERTILENEDNNSKRLILTKDTVEDPSKFDLI